MLRSQLVLFYLSRGEIWVGNFKVPLVIIATCWGQTTQPIFNRYLCLNMNRQHFWQFLKIRLNFRMEFFEKMPLVVFVSKMDQFWFFAFLFLLGATLMGHLDKSDTHNTLTQNMCAFIFFKHFFTKLGLLWGRSSLGCYSKAQEVCCSNLQRESQQNIYLPGSSKWK